MRYQPDTFTTASIAGGAALNTNRTGLPNYFNIVKVTVTADSAGGSFDVKIYKKDGFLDADLLAFWDDPTVVYDPMDDSSGTPAEAEEGAGIPYEDEDATGELHIRLVNNDTSAHTYTVTILYEEVPLMSAAGAATWRAGAVFAGALTGITNLTMSGTLTMGTSQAINATTSLLQQIGGTTVGTWAAGGLALARTSGNLSITAATTTSGFARYTASGYNTSTTIGGNYGGGVELRNIDTTNNNYTSVAHVRADGGAVTAGLFFINDNHGTGAYSLAFGTTPSGGSLTRVVNIDSTGSIVPHTDAAIQLGGTTNRFTLGFFSTRVSSGLATNATGEGYFATDGNTDINLDSASATAGTTNFIVMQRARGTQSARTVISADDVLGRLRWNGWDGDSYVSAAEIIGEADGTWGDGDGPGRLVFLTTADAASSPTEAMRIDKNQNVGIGASSFGTSAAKVLGIFNGTEPSTSPADMVQLYSVDLSAGNATLGLRTETAVAVEAALASTHTLAVRINGATYRILLTNA